MNGPAGVQRVAPWVLCAITLVGLGLGTWLRWMFPDVGPAEHVGWLEGAVSALGFAGIPVVGALIASRLPGNPYGWLWCLTGLAFGVADGASLLVRVAGGPIRVAQVLEAWGFVCLITLFVFLFLLFPTGRLPSSRWRWVGRGAVLGGLLLVLSAPFVPDPAAPAAARGWALDGAAGRYLGLAVDAGVFALFGLVLAGMSSLAVRFRRAGPVERQQLTWFSYATVVNAAVLLLDMFGLVLDGLIYTAVSAIAFALLPAAVGVAVLRYRLYEIDRIVSRTVSYGVLTAALVGTYLGVVAVLRPLLEPLTGSSTLSVAGSTLAVAAVFDPARRRLQAAVDRRFDRARYDAARAVDAFAARLRDQVDLDEVTTGLRDTVGATVAPTRVAVWLRVPSPLRGPEP